MKKYRLKQWYPSLPAELKVGDIVEFNGVDSIRRKIREKYEFTEYNWEFNGLELKCTQYWELIEDEEPLFITDDNIEVLSKEALIYIVNKNFYKKETELCNLYDKSNRKYFKYFFYESNADEYILWNKPLLSLHDIDSTAKLYLHDFDELKQLAKEKIEQ